MRLVLRKRGWDRVGHILYFFVIKNLKPIFVAVTFNFLLWDGDIHFWGTAGSCFSGSALDLQVFFPELSCSSWPTFGSSWKAWGCGLRRAWRPQQNPDGDKPAGPVLTEGAQEPRPSKQRHFRVWWERERQKSSSEKTIWFSSCVYSLETRGGSKPSVSFWFKYRLRGGNCSEARLC